MAAVVVTVSALRVFPLATTTLPVPLGDRARSALLAVRIDGTVTETKVGDAEARTSWLRRELMFVPLTERVFEPESIVLLVRVCAAESRMIPPVASGNVTRRRAVGLVNWTKTDPPGSAYSIEVPVGLDPAMRVRVDVEVPAIVTRPKKVGAAVVRTSWFIRLLMFTELTESVFEPESIVLLVRVWVATSRMTPPVASGKVARRRAVGLANCKNMDPPGSAYCTDVPVGLDPAMSVRVEVLVPVMNTCWVKVGSVARNFAACICTFPDPLARRVRSELVVVAAMESAVRGQEALTTTDPAESGERRTLAPADRVASVTVLPGVKLLYTSDQTPEAALTIPLKLREAVTIRLLMTAVALTTKLSVVTLVKAPEPPEDEPELPLGSKPVDICAGYIRRNMSRQHEWMTPAGGVRIADPVPFSFSIPAGFSPGQTSGSVACVDAFTARISIAPPLQIPIEMEAHITSGSVAYTQPNIGTSTAPIPGFPAGDNRISITWGGGPPVDYLLPQGLYGYTDIATQLNLIAAQNGWTTSSTAALFTLIGIQSTQKILLSVNPAAISAGGAFPPGGVIISFANPGVNGLNDSIGPILGFPTSGGGSVLTIAGGAGTTSVVTFAAPNVSNFAFTSAYAIYMSFLRDSYANGLTGKLLYVFQLGTAQPNTVLTVLPPLKYTIPMAAGSYSTVDVNFTDQSGNRLSLANFQSPANISLMLAKRNSDGSV